MKRSSKRETVRGPFDLLEEAVQLLRQAPGATLALYYLGSLPFVLGVLYFWSDMSRSPFAEQHLETAALGLSLLFLWMKCWQTAFAQQLLAQLSGATSPRWTFRQFGQVLMVQGIFQPSGLFLLPFALLLLFPFGWVFAFYQNITVLGRPSITMKEILQRAWRQTLLWPMENNAVLLVLKLFALFVVINWMAIMMAGPFLLKILLGIETVITQSPLTLLNSTLIAAVLGLSYLCVDPLIKACYALRCFYGESLQTGEDLQAELKKIWVRPARVAAVLVVSLFCLGPAASPATAASAPEGKEMRAAPALAPERLGRSIDEVIHRPEYAWRMPRAKSALADQPEGALARFFKGIGEWLDKAWKAFGKWLGDFTKWLEKIFRPVRLGKGGSVSSVSGLQSLLFVLIAVLAALLAVYLIRWWKQRQRDPVAAIEAEAISSTPDLASDQIGADQLPEEGWNRLAQEMLAKGEWRLAIRAFYLASLAHLAERNLLMVARYKSNREYQYELGLRAHELPQLYEVFREVVLGFDRIWYGLHPADETLARQFAGQLEKIKVS